MSKNLLIVDDDPDIQLCLRRHLEAQGYRVYSIGNGREALEALLCANYDGMLLDLHLPLRGGLDVLKTARGLGVRLPVLLMNSAASEINEDRVVGLGARGWVEKPFDLEQVDRWVRHWVGPP